MLPPTRWQPTELRDLKSATVRFLSSIRRSTTNQFSNCEEPIEVVPSGAIPVQMKAPPHSAAIKIGDLMPGKDHALGDRSQTHDWVFALFIRICSSEGKQVFDFGGLTLAGRSCLAN